MYSIAEDVGVLNIKGIVNLFLVGRPENWILVDTGLAGSAGQIQAAAEQRFGTGARPKAILLTHGHFDHAGSAPDLAELWDVEVYAHRMEWPFLTGKSAYPPMDPTAPGFFSLMSRFFPSNTANVGSRVRDLSESLPRLGFQEWEVVETPGHTPGHVSFFRRRDGLLLAGDAFATVNMDNFFKLLAKTPEVYRPAVPATTNWQQAHASVQKLAELRPAVIGAGHGKPMRNAADDLARLAAHFPFPKHGRYAVEPARFNEDGLTYVPPAPPDLAPKIAVGVAAGLAIAAAGLLIAKKSSGAFSTDLGETE